MSLIYVITEITILLKISANVHLANPCCNIQTNQPPTYMLWHLLYGRFDQENTEFKINALISLRSLILMEELESKLNLESRFQGNLENYKIS